jgi:hypothetical protein
MFIELGTIGAVYAGGILNERRKKSAAVRKKRLDERGKTLSANIIAQNEILGNNQTEEATKIGAFIAREQAQDSLNNVNLAKLDHNAGAVYNILSLPVTPFNLMARYIKGVANITPEGKGLHNSSNLEAGLKGARIGIYTALAGGIIAAAPPVAFLAAGALVGEGISGVINYGSRLANRLADQLKKDSK